MKKSILMLAAMAAFSLTPAAAGTLYSNYAAWSAAVSGISNVTIPDPSPIQYIDLGIGTVDVTYGGVNFAQNSAIGKANLLIVGPLLTSYPTVISSQSPSKGVSNILITLPALYRGLAFNYGTFFGKSLTFKLSNGEVYSKTPTGNDYTTKDFFGVVSSPFDSILITTADPGLNIRDVAYGSAVPEPSSMMLLGGGLLLVAGLRRRF